MPQHKVVLVTGASSGIGEATGRALAKAGYHVVLAARRTDRIEAVAQEIINQGGQASTLTLDVTDFEAVTAGVEQIVQEHGQLDSVVCNAGVMLLAGIADADVNEWRRMIDVNVMGVSYTIKAALPHLLKSKGHIVAVSSVAGRVTVPQFSMYCATKWAVFAFCDTIRQELAPQDVRVTLIEPGGVSTELMDHITDDTSKQFLQEFEKSMEFLKPEDIAAGVVYALTQPPNVSVSELTIRPTQQAL